MAVSDNLVVAVDVGSGSARAAVVDGGGHILGRGAQVILLNRPVTDHAEHSSTDIWLAVCTAVRRAVAESKVQPARIRGIGFDATCSLVLLDATGAPASVSTSGEDRWNVVMWADHRAVAEADEITRLGHRVLEYVGGVMSPEMEIPKLLWLKRHLPRQWPRYARAFDLADFLVWRASGNVAISACTVTCKWTFLNHETIGWQRDFLAAVGLDDLPQRAALPDKVAQLGGTAGLLSTTAAAELGLTTDCHVGVGIIDAHAGGLGVLGGVDWGTLDRRVALIAGTSTCHMAVSAKPRSIPGVWGPYYGAMMPGLWLNEGGQSATGSLLEHILDWHAEGRALGGDRHGVVTARIEALLAEQGPRFAAGLMVLPDFHGNRSPLADPQARGVIHGLGMASGPDSLAELYYATALGIVFGTRHILDAMNRAGYAVDTLHLTGGHVANPLLVRLYADATGCNVVLPAEPDGVLVGTAALAAAACGLYPSLAASAGAMARSGREVAPDASLARVLDARYRAFLIMHEQRQHLDELLHQAV